MRVLVLGSGAREHALVARLASERDAGDIVAAPSGKRIEWKGMDVIPFENGKVKRKDVYSDSISILRQVGLL